MMGIRIGGSCSIPSCSHVAGHSGRCSTVDLEAENARLRERVFDREAEVDGLVVERDGYKALAEEGQEHVARLEAAVEAFEEAVKGAEALAKVRGEALTGLMPLMDDGECCYCSWGSQVQEDGHHFDADNIWDGDPICLNDSHYDDARDAIALTPEEALAKEVA